MTIESFFSGLVMVLIGAGMMYSYLYYVKKKLNVNLGFLESILYKANTENAPSSVQFVASVLNAVKFLGLLFIITAVIAMFNPR